MLELLENIQKKVTKFKLQKQAEHELFQLTDRELRDLGISRSDIYRIVYETYERTE